MGGPGPEKSGGIKKMAGVENMRITESQLNMFFDRVSPEMKKKHAEARRKAARNVMIEEGERKAELAKLNEDLQIEEPDKEVFTEEEREALMISIRSYRESEGGTEGFEDMCQAHMRSLRARKLFKSRFSAWEAGFKREHPDIAAKEDYKDSPEFQMYIRERGAEFIKETRKIIVEDTTGSFIKNNREDITEEEAKAKNAELGGGINAFIDENYNDLLSDDEEIKKGTYEKFKKMMDGYGYGDIDEVKIKALFEKVITTVVFQYLSTEEFSEQSAIMVDNVDVEMTDEEWEEMLNAATEKKYRELEEKIREDRTVAVSAGGISITTSDGTYKSIEDFGRSSGVVFRPVPGREDQYYVDSDKIDDKSRLPVVRIRNGYFEMEIMYADKNEKYDGDTINNHPSKKYGYSNFREAINRQLLDYQLNVRAQVKQTESVRENPNEVINDRQMQRLAVSLFGFGLNERTLSKQHLEGFSRLCRVIMKDDGDPMAVRLDKMIIFMSNRSNADVIRRILKNDGSKVHNVKGLIEYARQIRMGKMKEGQGIAI